MGKISSIRHPWTGRALMLTKAHLPDIRWIAGGSCGGKTVSSSHIAGQTGLRVYNGDLHRQEHFEKAAPDLYPALSREIVWPDFFASSTDQIFEFWEALCFERMEMILDDLSMLETDGPVLAEGVYPTPEILKAVTPLAPAVFLFADEEFMRTCYYGRESTLWMEGPISTCKDPEKTKKEWMSKWFSIDINRQKRASECGYPCLEATVSTNWKAYEDKIMHILLIEGFSGL